MYPTFLHPIIAYDILKVVVETGIFVKVLFELWLCVYNTRDIGTIPQRKCQNLKEYNYSLRIHFSKTTALAHTIYIQ